MSRRWSGPGSGPSSCRRPFGCRSTSIPTVSCDIGGFSGTNCLPLAVDTVSGEKPRGFALYRLKSVRYPSIRTGPCRSQDEEIEQMRFLRAFLPALAVLAMFAVPAAPSKAAVAIGISVNLAPPVLPVYEQPPIPGPGYLWTPGYWAWGPEGYYWVPGTWVYPPVIGVLWT